MLVRLRMTLHNTYLTCPAPPPLTAFGNPRNVKQVMDFIPRNHCPSICMNKSFFFFPLYPYLLYSPQWTIEKKLQIKTQTGTNNNNNKKKRRKRERLSHRGQRDSVFIQVTGSNTFYSLLTSGCCSTRSHFFHTVAFITFVAFDHLVSLFTL